MKSILITGCNRGLGLGLVKQLVKEKNAPKHLIATCRNLEKAEELKSIAEQHKNVHLLQLDVKATDQFEAFSQQVSEVVKEDGLNVLFNNAGVSPKSTRLNFVKVDQLLETFTTNTVAPIMLTKALLPLLKRAAENNSSQPLGISRAAIINMSSILGSISSNEITGGGLYPYRCSKAALNMATKTLSVDLKNDGILVTCIHPGWVKTSMGGSNAPLEVDASTSSIVKLLPALGDKHNGGFYQWDGKKLDW